MAPRAKTHRIPVPRGANREAASFIAQLDDQSRRLLEDLRGVSAAELAWQPRAGANTIGMLLAHIAIVEVYWSMIAMQRFSDAAFQKALGIGVDDDGMPMPAGARPPAVQRGETLAYYKTLHSRARAFAKQSVVRLPDSVMENVVARRRRTGETMRHSLRWILYHQLEHFATHYGQILLLRHLYRDRAKK